MRHADELTSLATSQAQIGENPARVPAVAAVAAPSQSARHGSGRRLFLDATLLLASLAFAGVATHDVVGTLQTGWVVCYGALVLLVDRLLRRSPQPIKVSVVNDVRGVLLSTSVAAIGTLSLRVLATDSPTATSETLGVWGFSVIALVTGAIVSSWLVVRSRRARADAKPTLIIGAGSVGQLLARRLLDRPDLGLRPVGFLDKDPLPLNAVGTNLPVLGASWDLDNVVARHEVTHVVVAFSTAPHDVLLRTVRRCNELDISVSFVPRLFEKMTARVSVDHLGGLPLISIHPADPRGRRFKLKYTLERVMAAILLVILLPLLVVTTVGVWLSLGRPILYRQRRIGLDGQEFDILKFRSMRSAPDDERADLNLRPDIAPGGITGTERRTRFGKFIRATSIDELPQLINVLWGEMSLVGPRPERPEFAEVFHEQIHRYGERLRVKSGITGWAQVNGLRGQTSLSERVELDNHYIENWSFGLDLKILVLTVRAVLRFNAD
jgi:exopolysaccharide biosynthesis polyprenyl glycosylphosphotransferase